MLLVSAHRGLPGWADDRGLWFPSALQTALEDGLINRTCQSSLLALLISLYTACTYSYTHTHTHTCINTFMHTRTHRTFTPEKYTFRSPNPLNPTTHRKAHTHAQTCTHINTQHHSNNMRKHKLAGAYTLPHIITAHIHMCPSKNARTHKQTYMHTYRQNNTKTHTNTHSPTNFLWSFTYHLKDLEGQVQLDSTTISSNAG